jgi:zinc protease
MTPDPSSRHAPDRRRGQAAVLAAALALLTSAVPAFAAPAEKKPAPAAGAPANATHMEDPHGDDPVIRHEVFVLPNGLQVILVPDQSVPLVAVSVWYHVGSGSENHGKSGFAHLFEHMLFQGSKNVGSDRHFEILRKIGASNVNGTTNSDRTNYFEVVPSNQLETALWLESDRMSHLLPLLTEQSFRNQVDVVRNERRQRYDDVPYGKARFALAAALFPEGHPYRYLTIGRHEDLERASLEDVTAFYKTWYVPANATLAIGGDFDVVTAKKLVLKWFGGFPISEKPKLVAVAPPPAKAGAVTVDDDFAKLRLLQFVWLSPGNFQPGDAELDLLANALGDEGTGRLYRILVFEKQLAQAVSVAQAGAGFSGTFNINVVLRSGADAEAVKRIVADEVARLGREPLSDGELRRGIIGYESQAVYGLEDLLSRVERLQTYNHYLGSPDRLSWDLDRYRSTSFDKLRAVASEVLTPARMTVIMTLPSAAPATPAPAGKAKP